ncbi:hypothetical protein FKM82_009231 [Ascaphus truei]
MSGRTYPRQTIRHLQPFPTTHKQSNCAQATVRGLSVCGYPFKCLWECRCHSSGGCNTKRHFWKTGHTSLFHRVSTFQCSTPQRRLGEMVFVVKVSLR